ncbi:MAG: hypothetical protein ACRDGE_07420 [Candidatus Limnocylindria bacterium]
MDERERPFGNEEDADTITSAIPSRSGREDGAPMPEQEDADRQQAPLPTQVSDRIRTER